MLSAKRFTLKATRGCFVFLLSEAVLNVLLFRTLIRVSSSLVGVKTLLFSTLKFDLDLHFVFTTRSLSLGINLRSQCDIIILGGVDVFFLYHTSSTQSP